MDIFWLAALALSVLIFPLRLGFSRFAVAQARSFCSPGGPVSLILTSFRGRGCDKYQVVYHNHLTLVRIVELLALECQQS